MLKTIIHSSSLDQAIESKILRLIPGAVEKFDGFYCIRHQDPTNRDVLNNIRQEFSIDINTLPESFNSAQVALVISDMDSTLISIECVDEIADFLGIKDQVAAITESAMRGEIDFNTSLTERVKLLKGLDFSVLETVYRERLTLNPGAEQLITGLHANGIKFALVSGGFTFFTERLKQRLNLDFTLSNTLTVEDGKLAGSVVGDIVNGDIKAGFLAQLSNELNIDLTRTIAIGDGANDLKMLGLSGLGVAYRAKPKVQMQADAVLNYAGLDAILHFLQV